MITSTTNDKTFSSKSNAKRAAVREITKSLNITEQAAKDLEDKAYSIIETGERFSWIRILNENRRAMAYTKAGDAVPAADLEFIETYGTAYCPQCKEHLSNGVLDNAEHLADLESGTLNMMDGESTSEKIAEHIAETTNAFECMACGNQFGPELSLKAKAKVARPKVNKSSVEGPCALVWALAEKMTAEGARRKDVIEEAQKQGVAYYTARTQYQAWKAAKNKS